MTATDLLSTRDKSPMMAALTLLVSLKTLDSQYRVGYVMRGLILRECEDRELWRHIPAPDGGMCRSQEHFMKVALPWSVRDSHYALGAARDLRELPAEKLAEMPRVNIEQLRKMSTSVRALPDVLDSAQRLGGAEFVEYVNTHHPGQALEHRQPLPKVSESTRSVLDEAVELAMRVEQTQSRDDAVTAIATYYLQGDDHVYSEN